VASKLVAEATGSSGLAALASTADRRRGLLPAPPEELRPRWAAPRDFRVSFSSARTFVLSFRNSSFVKAKGFGTEDVFSLAGGVPTDTRSDRFRMSSPNLLGAGPRHSGVPRRPSDPDSSSSSHGCGGGVAGQGPAGLKSWPDGTANGSKACGGVAAPSRAAGPAGLMKPDFMASAGVHGTDVPTAAMGVAALRPPALAEREAAVLLSSLFRIVIVLRPEAIKA